MSCEIVGFLVEFLSIFWHFSCLTREIDEQWGIFVLYCIDNSSCQNTSSFHNNTMWYQSYWHFLCLLQHNNETTHNKECWCKLSSFLSKFLQQNQFHSFFLDDSCKNHIAINDAPKICIYACCVDCSHKVFQSFLQEVFLADKNSCNIQWYLRNWCLSLLSTYTFINCSCHFLVTSLSLSCQLFLFFAICQFHTTNSLFQQEIFIFNTIFSCSCHYFPQQSLFVVILQESPFLIFHQKTPSFSFILTNKTTHFRQKS